MATGLTKYGDISVETAYWAAQTALTVADAHIVFGKLGTTKPMPKNKSETVEFRRPVLFPPSTVPLQEGVTPTPTKMSYERVRTSLQQYGMVIAITDKVRDLSGDPVLKDAMMLAGRNASDTIEEIAYGVLRAGTNVIYSNGASRAAVNTAITANKVRAAVRVLEANKARKITQIMGGSVDYETYPIEAGYVAVAHTHLSADIRNLSGFIPVAKYGNRRTVSNREIGSFEDVRFLTSADMRPFVNAGGTPGSAVLSTGGTAADVYPVLFFGEEAFGHVPLKGEEAIMPVVVNATPSAADPLAQRSFVGWKAYNAVVILNQGNMVRIECAASALG